MRVDRIGGWVEGFSGWRDPGEVVRSLIARDGDTGPFLDGGHDGFASCGPIAGKGEAAIGQVANAHIDADDILALLFLGSAIFRDCQSAVLELMVQPCCQDEFGAAGTDPRCIRNEF